jgi:tripeptidyl-peptidase-2
MLRLTSHAPHERYTDTEARTYTALGVGDEGHLTARVAGGSTLEVTVAQFWSSAGAGPLSVEVAFHGLTASPSAVSVPAAGDAVRVTVRAGVRAERLAPKARLHRVRRAVRPDAPGTVDALSPDRDALPRGRRGHGLLLTHTVDVAEGGGTYEASIPLLSARVYDAPVDGATTMAYDAHKRLLGVSDAYPAKIKVGAGVKKVTFRTLVRHESPAFLAGLACAPLQVDRLLDAPVEVPVYGSHADAAAATAAAAAAGDGKGGDAVGGPLASAAKPGATTLKERTLHAGERAALFVGPLPDAKLPKDAAAGSVLVGEVSLGRTARRDRVSEAHGLLNGTAGEEKGEANVKVRKGG